MLIVFDSSYNKIVDSFINPFNFTFNLFNIIFFVANFASNFSKLLFIIIANLSIVILALFFYYFYPFYFLYLLIYVFLENLIQVFHISTKVVPVKYPIPALTGLSFNFFHKYHTL